MVSSGCGASEGTAITRAEFIEDANAVCAKARKRIQAEFTAYGEGEEAREAERGQRAGELTANQVAANVGVKILVPAMRREVEELRSLGIPSKGEHQAEALLDAFDEGVERAEAHPERAARDGTEAFGEPGRLAREYGIESC